VIRFSAFLVAVALGLLVAGVVTSKLTLVYVAIGVSGVALLALGVGALLKRNELFGQPKSAEPGPVRPEPAAAYLPPAQPQPQLAPWEAAPPAASAWPAAVQPAPYRVGYLPADQPVNVQPAFPAPAERPAERPADVPRRPAAFTPRPPTAPPSRPPGVPAPGTWEWPSDAPATQPLREMRRPASSVPDTPPEAVESPQVAESQPPVAQDQPVAPDELPARDEQPAESQPSADQQTQQLPVVASAAAEPVPAPSDTAPAPAATEPPPAAVDLQQEVTVVPGVPRYHNAQCLLIRFMGENDLAKMTLGAARESGCTPCRACLPDQQEANSDLDPPEPERQAEIVLDVLPCRPGLRTCRRARPWPEIDGEHLDGDQRRVLGQGRGHLWVAG
jgi:hypothetical protein